jgi:hypothetical protein
MTGLPRAARQIPPSTASRPYPGRTPHWIRPNAAERIPVRWLVADCESKPRRDGPVEVQTLRCWSASRWRTDLKSGEARETARGTDAAAFWAWALEWCHTHGRTVLWFHHASVDLAWLAAFEQLPAAGCELVWCNLDRDVSVATWKTPGGTLVIADTWTWTAQPLEALSGMVSITKPPLPKDDDSIESWHARCDADVAITEAVVRELLDYVRTRHLGNWQPSGAGMGYTTWRHRFYTHKILVHDDSDALAAEREAMHAGRAEAWWHGKAQDGPFTEWDMRMSYTTIASECLLPTKFWDHDKAPTRRIHRWALEHFRVLARVTVRTAVPVVPARIDDRITWPVGEFETMLWDNELALITATGGRYKVHEQWRYTRKPCLKAWADWSIEQVSLGSPVLTDVQRTWVKHQARATIGRMGLRTASWQPYCDNWMPAYTGLSLLSEAGQPDRRLMHVGGKVWAETGKEETQQSVPQITSWIMAEARVRLWNACQAAGLDNVLHVDTDSLITNAAGTAAIQAAIHQGLPGHWRPKATWRKLEITGPRHYAAPGRRQLPGIPKRAVKRPDGKYEAEVWESLATTMAAGRTGEVRVTTRPYEPRRVDYRRPYQGETSGPAIPIKVPKSCEEDTSEPMEQRRA